MVNTRLIWFLEKNKIIHKEQSGFRQSRSTINNLHIIKSEIDLAFEKKQTLGMVSLDISKAYDSVWKHRVFILLSKILACGNINNYIKDFLTDRHFQLIFKPFLTAKWYSSRIFIGSNYIFISNTWHRWNNKNTSNSQPICRRFHYFNILIRSQNIKTVKYFLQETIDSLTKL